MKLRLMHINILCMLAAMGMLAGCQTGSAPQPTASVPFIQIASPTAQPTRLEPSPVAPSTTPSPTQLPTPTGTPTRTPTPGPYAGLSIDELTGRSYGGGELEYLDTIAANSYFTRTLIAYPSDELTIYGFMNEPRRGNPPYPVVIALHGYIDPAIYSTLDYTTRYADSLAREGFLVLHPNLRGYPPSDSGDNRFRVGMAVDVLNLIALVKSQAGQPGPLEDADPQAIGLWGHSMGGGISTRVITISPDVRAVLLYGAMSGDERRNFERIFNYFSNGERGQEELSAPEDVFELLSPINYLDRIRAAVSVHHGEQDPDVPPAWSADLCFRLEELGKDVECFTYPDQAHTFHGEGDVLFMQRAVDFFNRKLRER